MREVFSDRDSALVGLYQSMLQNEGIACFVSNPWQVESSSVAFGPTLCVDDEESAVRAREIIRQYAAGAAPGTATADWKCAECGETSPGTFGSCWQCGALRPGANGAENTMNP